MAEFISKAAIVAHIEEQSREWGEEYDAEQILGDLEDFPAADVVERKNGKWIWDDEGYHCSECFYHAYGNTAEIYSGQYNYCPNCGARMEG